MCKWALGITACVTVAVLVIAVIPYLKYIQYDETICQVENIEYPQTILILLIKTFGENVIVVFIVLHIQVCTKIYVSLINFNHSENMYLVKKDRDSIRDSCTFYSSECHDMENVLFLYQEIENAKTIFNDYFNQTISCYYSEEDEEVVLSNTYDWLTMVLVCVGICFLVLICKCCLCKNEDDNRDPAFV